SGRIGRDAMNAKLGSIGALGLLIVFAFAHVGWADDAKRALTSDLVRYERNDGPDGFRHIEIDFHADGTVHVWERVQGYSTHRYDETLPAAELAQLAAVEKDLEGIPAKTGPEGSELRLWQKTHRNASPDDGLSAP